MAVAAAEKLGLVGRPEALALIDQTLSTLGKLERLHGFFYNYYDTTTLERTSNFVSSVNSSWLTAGLMVVRSAFPELAERAGRLIEDGDYGWLYDPAEGLMSHGYYVNLGCASQYHYGLLYTEARVLSLIAIGKGDVPEAHWFKLMRTLPPEETWQTQPPQGRHAKQVRGQTFMGGWYEHGGERYLPSWGGSMFEALMPTLVVDENAFAPKASAATTSSTPRSSAATRSRSWAIRSGACRRALPLRATATVSSASPTSACSATPTAWSRPTPLRWHWRSRRRPQFRTSASSRDRYAIYGAYGFYDAVDPKTGKVALRYLTLDQGMLFIAIANHLADHAVQRDFAADPIAAKVLPMLAEEHFFD